MGFRDKIKNVFKSGDDKNKEIVPADTSESSSYGQSNDVKSESSSRNILFVCNSNTFISPMAELIFNQLSDDRMAFSAGLNAQSGEGAPREGVMTAAYHDIGLSNHTATNIRDFSIGNVGLILTSTGQIRDALKMKCPNLDIFTMKEYAGEHSNLDIEDPFGGDLIEYELCFREINDAVLRIAGVKTDTADEPAPVEDEVVEEPAPVEEEVADEPGPVEDETGGEVGNVRNFKYLDDLIHSGETRILLDYDIVLDDDESSEYEYGIEINGVLYIDGNGHSIDARDKTRIFKLDAKKVILRNLIFKNGFAPYGGAIFIYDSTYSIIEKDCHFNDNRAAVDGGAIFTQGKVVVQDCHFDSNFAEEDGGAISNQGMLEVSYSKLVGNGCKDRGGSIYSSGTLKLFESEFKDNIYETGENSLYHMGGFINRGTYFSDKYMGFALPAEETELKTDKNFRYLDYLIRSGVKEIILDSNIYLNDDEFKEYEGGITIDENDLVIDGNGFSIDARNKARIFTINGHNVVLKNIAFKNAYSFAYGGAAIQNFGKTEIESSKFLGNDSEHNMAGAIVNVENADLKLTGCEFRSNHAREYAVLNNFSKLEIRDCIFSDNISAEICGVLGNSGEVEIYNSKFINNTTSQAAGAIINWGEIKIFDSLFDNNYTNGAGGAVFNKEGCLFVSGSCFENNFSSDGGAIFNFDNIDITGSRFANNVSRDDGGVIFNYEIGKGKITDCEFENNDSFEKGSCIYNKNELQITDSTFEGHNNDNDLLFNESELELRGLTFSKNRANSLIMNEGESKVSVDGGKASNNCLKASSIFNQGRFFLNTFAFDDNRSHMPCAENVYNGGELYLSDVKVLNENGDKTILNKGYIEAKELTKALKETICDKGELKVIYGEESDTPFNFNHLDYLIRSNGDSIELDEDILVLDKELYFYEGGIELNGDGLVIDGKNRCIDGCGKTRIFNVVGRDVVVKNITLKNGFSENGGGAINIVKGASLKLIDCKIIDNSSSGDGGAILNNGDLELVNANFNSNEAENMGGGIFNSGSLTVDGATFSQNKSRRGLSIYNNGALNILGIDFDNELFNNHSITSSSDLGGDVSDIGFINRAKSDAENFTHLSHEINISNEITLENDIVFNYIEDKNLINGFEIAKDLMIDGDGHIIDGNGSASLFNISGGEILFKNVVFRNCYSSTGPIIENGSSLTFENCRFINNHPRFSKSLIENNGKLRIVDSTFSNHYIRNNSLLVNNSEIEIKGTSFIAGRSESKGSALSNFNTADIKGSAFENNFSKEVGGAILNDGRLDVLSTRFVGNISGEYGGTIYNKGDSTIYDCQFLGNSARRNGGTIYNVYNSEISGNASDFIQNLLIDGCDFNDNDAGGLGGSIFNSGVFDLQNSYFIENTAHEGGAIYMADKGAAYIGMCKFKRNKADDGGAIYQKRENIRFRNCTAEDNVPNDANM